MLCINFYQFVYYTTLWSSPRRKALRITPKGDGKEVHHLTHLRDGLGDGWVYDPKRRVYLPGSPITVPDPRLIIPTINCAPTYKPTVEYYETYGSKRYKHSNVFTTAEQASELMKSLKLKGTTSTLKKKHAGIPANTFVLKVQDTDPTLTIVGGDNNPSNDCLLFFGCMGKFHSLGPLDEFEKCKVLKNYILGPIFHGVFFIEQGGHFILNYTPDNRRSNTILKFKWNGKSLEEIKQGC